MLSTAHLMTGAAIGTVVESPWQIIIISIVLHFIWDSWPHWDPDYTKWKKRDWYLAASFDLLAGLCLSLWVVGSNLNWVIVLAMFASIFPDILTMFAILAKIKWLNNYLRWHKKIQNSVKLKHGLLFQILVVLIAVMVIRLAN